MVLGGGVVYPEFPVRTRLDTTGAIPRCVSEVESLLEAVADNTPGVVIALDLTMPGLPENW